MEPACIFTPHFKTHFNVILPSSHKLRKSIFPSLAPFRCFFVHLRSVVQTPHSTFHTHAVSCWGCVGSAPWLMSLTVEILLKRPESPYGVCGGRRRYWDFPPSTSGFSCQYDFISVPNSFFYYQHYIFLKINSVIKMEVVLTGNKPINGLHFSNFMNVVKTSPLSSVWLENLKNIM
jgi:hypothetical protein